MIEGLRRCPRWRASRLFAFVIVDANGNAGDDHMKHEGRRICHLIKQGRQLGGSGEGPSFDDSSQDANS